MQLDEVGLPRRKARPSEVAKLLGVTYLTINRWMRQGKLKVYRVSPRVSYLDLDEVARLSSGDQTRG